MFPVKAQTFLAAFVSKTIHIKSRFVEVHSASYPKGTGGPFPGRKVAEADHSLPTRIEVKNTWTCASTPQYVLMAQCLVKHRHNFFLFPFYVD